MEANYTHLLFIDGDISFKVEDIFSMIDTDLDLIGGVYSKKRIDWNLIKHAVLNNVPADQLHRYTGSLNFNVLEESPSISDVYSPLEVKHVPTGFMLIKRQVFEKLSDITPSYIDYEDNAQIKAFFETSISNDKFKMYNSEDWHFCDEWRKIGGKAYIAPWVVLNHFGTYNFQGSIIDGNTYNFNKSCS